jgi:Domain of unknown function (DUF4330)
MKSNRLNPIDGSVLVLALLCVLGFAATKAGHAGVNNVIEGSSKVAIEVFITGLKTRDLDLFKVGEKTAITVRNQPLTPKMTIAKVEHNQKQTSFLTPDGKKVLAYPDPANAIAQDFLVTVVDSEAPKTEDGYVVRGQKIKIGNQIELEGFKYRVQGVVVDIRPEP